MESNGEKTEKKLSFEDFQEFLRNLAEKQQRIEEREEREQEQKLAELADAADGNMDIIRSMFEKYEESFSREFYKRNMSNLPYWSSYEEFLRCVCMGVESMEDDVLKKIPEYDEDPWEKFENNVNICLESAKRNGKNFTFGEMAGLYAKLRECHQSNDGQLRNEIRATMYGTEYGKPNIAWLDEYADEDENGPHLDAQDCDIPSLDDSEFNYIRTNSELRHENNQGTGKKYLSDIIDINEIVKGKLNLIYVPTGCGKTTFAEGKLKDMARESPQPMLCLVPTTPLYQSIEERGVQGMKVMTYAAFGQGIKKAKESGAYRSNEWWNDRAVICLDELSEAVGYLSFKNNEGIRIALDEIIKRVRNDENIVVAIDATPKKLADFFAIRKHLGIKAIFSACGLEGYLDKEIIRYSNLENLVESVNPNQRGIVFTKQIAGIEKTVELFRNRGINAVGIWSIHNNKHPMDKEQLRVRESLIKDEKIPDEVQVIVLNASYKVGINIKPEKSRLDYIIVNDSNDDVVTQARGRYRGDIDILYRKETGNASAIASESTIRNIVKPYLGVRLNKEQRNRLREELGIFDNRGLLSWPKTAKLLESYEYVVENNKSGSTRYCVISDASK